MKIRTWKFSQFIVISLVSVPLVVASGGRVALGGFIAVTSFENQPVPTSPPPLYVDTGNPSADHDLVNNPGQPLVDSLGGQSDLGFDATYIDTPNGSTGLTDGDAVGVTEIPPEPPSVVVPFPDGNQGYAMEDPDGKMLLTFDPVDLVGHIGKMVMLDLYIGKTQWDVQDKIVATVTTDVGDFTLLDTTGFDIDDLQIEGFWMTISAAIPDAASTGTLKVSLESNATDEELWLDNVRFTSAPEPAAQTLLILGALFGLVRYRAPRRRWRLEIS